MEDGSGWFDDPEVEGQERYFDGSEWTTETRPTDLDGPDNHLPDHVPELQRAFAAATADIEEVEAQLGLLFDRTEASDAGTKKGRKASKQKAEPDPPLHAEFTASTETETKPVAPAASAAPEAEAKGQPAIQAGDSAQAAGVESLLGTERDDDRDPFAELDEALATEEPEKLKRKPFRRRS